MRGAQEHSGCGPEQIDMGGEVLGGLWFNVKDRQKPKKTRKPFNGLRVFMLYKIAWRVSRISVTSAATASERPL